MERTLRQHITHLEERISNLKNEIENPHRSSVEREQTLIDLGIAERSLAHFKRAYELEQKLQR